MFFAWHCSGDMYANLPLMVPLLVAVSRSSALAMPKSTMRTSPSKVTTRFWGEMSRWTRLSGLPPDCRVWA